MSFVTTTPEAVAAACADLARIGTSITQANAAASAATTEIVVAGGDEVSEAIARLFGAFAQEYQALGAGAALFHDQFVQAIRTGAGAYSLAEAANTWPLLQAVAEPARAWVGSPGGMAAPAAVLDDSRVLGLNAGLANIGNYNIGLGSVGDFNVGGANLGI